MLAVVKVVLLLLAVSLTTTTTKGRASAFIITGGNSGLGGRASSPSQLSFTTSTTTTTTTRTSTIVVSSSSPSAAVSKSSSHHDVLKSTTFDDEDDDNDDEGVTIRFERPSTDFMPSSDFTVVGDDDNDNGDTGDYYTTPRSSSNDRSRRNFEESSAASTAPRAATKPKSKPPPPPPPRAVSAPSISTTRPRRPQRIRKPPADRKTNMVGTSWMEKNAKFTNESSQPQQQKKVDDTPNSQYDRSSSSSSSDRSYGNGNSNSNNDNKNDSSSRFQRTISDPKTFRQDFRKTRVFVQGIPNGVSWQDLKDHFRVAGNVVFASVSVDPETGESKGHGIVQFETTDMAQKAIDVMRDHPLDGQPLFVREDVQESKDQQARLRDKNLPKGPTPPTMWKCANEDNAMYMSEGEQASIRSLIKARDDARRRKKYDVSDRIREDLKETYGVFIDDRLKMWWTSVDGNKVPQSIHDIKGDGRWKLQPWRMIPTTPENDACVNTDLVEGLLKQRDIARREKDFATADALLEEARTSPDGDLNLRIHDESRTWRVWTETSPRFEGSTPPPRRRMTRDEEEEQEHDPDRARKMAALDCISIVKEHAPEKIDEITMVLKKFPGREFQVLKRLKNQYL